jgi:hypothetical protein
MSDNAGRSPGHENPYTLHCRLGILTDAFPRPCRSRNEALSAASELLISPRWTRDMRLRLDGPNGQSWDTNEIRRMLMYAWA